MNYFRKITPFTLLFFVVTGSLVYVAIKGRLASEATTRASMFLLLSMIVLAVTDILFRLLFRGKKLGYIWLAEIVLLLVFVYILIII